MERLEDACDADAVVTHQTPDETMSDLRVRLVDVRGIREVDAPTSEPLRGDYGRLANAYLEVAYGHSGDPTDRQLDAAIPTATACSP